MAHILIVDDEVKLSRIVARFFAGRGHRVTCLASGEEAVIVARRQRPDIALVDLHMDGMDGLATTVALRKVVPGLPVLLLTGDDDVQNAAQAAECGAADFVPKPFDIDELVANVERRAGSGSPPTIVAA